MTNCHIRPLATHEYAILADLLYEALYIPEGEERPPRSVIEQPELSLYIEDFGVNRHDHAWVIDLQGTLAGGAWVRIMDDYGHVDDETPSLAIAIFESYRGRGYGRALMTHLMQDLKSKGYTQLSLSVIRANYAYRLYQSLGFQTVADHGDELVMLCQL